jgi:hypothetical protein
MVGISVSWVLLQICAISKYVLHTEQGAPSCEMARSESEARSIGQLQVDMGQECMARI